MVRESQPLTAVQFIKKKRQFYYSFYLLVFRFMLLNLYLRALNILEIFSELRINLNNILCYSASLNLKTCLFQRKILVTPTHVVTQEAVYIHLMEASCVTAALVSKEPNAEVKLQSR